MSQNHIREQIELIAKHEEDFLARRNRVERVGDRIASWVGSLPFVCVHVVLFAAWVLWNVLEKDAAFDPRPFSLLGTLVALEGILLASFILMRQGRIGRRADERDHLMLQILLLAEKELTAGLRMDREIAKGMGLREAANDPEVKELSQETSIDDVAETIKETLGADE